MRNLKPGMVAHASNPSHAKRIAMNLKPVCTSQLAQPYLKTYKLEIQSALTYLG